MKPGPELDALIAEKVMEIPTPPGPGWIKPYSTSIAAAWEVVEKMLTILEGNFSRPFTHNIECTVTGKITHVVFFGTYEAMGVADTASHAICLAALRYQGVDIEN